MTNAHQSHKIPNISLHAFARWCKVISVINTHTSQLSIFGGAPAGMLDCARSWGKESRPQAPVSEEALVPG
jgi:hypothetical protein